MNVFEQPLNEGCWTPAIVKAEILEKPDFFNDTADIEVFELFWIDEIVERGLANG